MKLISVLCCVFLISGCGNLRFAPGEIQKQNAYVHVKTAELAAKKAKEEKTSVQLQALTDLSSLQSTAVLNYYGKPQTLPECNSIEQVLSAANFEIAKSALAEANRKPDPLDVADNLLEFGLALAGLLGGVFGAKAVKFLQSAREKTQALKEIIEGNELFKEKYEQMAHAFKESQDQTQSTETKAIVAQMK
jgi:hypothetical protein